MPILDRAWRDWLTTNVERGCSAESMIDAMIASGFDHGTAREAVKQIVLGKPVALGQATPPAATSAASATTATSSIATSSIATSNGYHYEPCPVPAGNVVRAGGRDVKVLLRCERPQVIVFGDVLSADECHELMERSRHRLKRSTTVNETDGSEDVIQNRTSEGIWFQRCEDPFITTLDERIAELMNWPMNCGEGLQILHYNGGGEYRPHFDYFPPDQAGSARHTAHGGQRVATLIVYLNDVDGGGETIFPEAGLSVVAKQGGAVYFSYMNSLGELDPLTLHGGAPVLTGEKWIMTKWMRQRAYE
ncbi:2OG-Fe(II) oxygenase [Paraburkholderia megapolitana]|uniref:Prolyl 4-hydroxylase n=1 Tax=Paraburkholderia megapolitana TaxID=420953 RepID=A0A1I3DNC5_9BURK|nr:2OG-Fe(II) oxygenase [Paraburkholderia megapolitana]QDQ81942.1 2-oxoglutarate-dependent dioxygenase [Paraburkholderia megapolitana]SFH88079.1 prolyl 4-hydroxylase [Paraburkholderia megapolitana]